MEWNGEEGMERRGMGMIRRMSIYSLMVWIISIYSLMVWRMSIHSLMILPSSNPFLQPKKGQSTLKAGE